MLPSSVIWMNECAALRRLPPLFKTEAKVIKCDAVDMEALTVGSVYTNKLRREVQHLPELRLALA